MDRWGLLFILLFCSNILSAGGDETSFNDYSINLSGEPTGIVGGVNVITGNYTESTVDLVIPGPTPLVIGRQYSSSINSGGTLYHGWDCNHQRYICLENFPKFYIGHKCTSGSSVVKYYAPKNKKFRNEFVELELLASEYCKGTTNTSSGYIGALTHQRNSIIKYCEGKNQLYRIDADGTHGYYEPTEKNSPYFTLTSEQFPNGYRKKSTKNRLKHLVFQQISPQGNVLGQVVYDDKNKKEFETNPVMTLHSNDGRQVVYKFKSHKYKRDETEGHYLSEVQAPEAPLVKYEYKNKSNMLEKKILPDNRFLFLEHYSRGKNFVLDNKIKISSVNDTRYHRIRKLQEPVGVDETPITTQQFIYDVKTEVKNDKLVIKSGSTEVYDAYNTRTVYHYPDRLRLGKIEKFSKHGVISTTEKLNWTIDGKLLGRGLCHINGAFYFYRNYVYDDYGNVLENRLYGNLSGNQEPLFSVNIDGAVKKPDIECHVKKFTYNDRHLVETETDGDRQECYTYVGKTNLVLIKVTKVAGNIISRELNSYDCEHLHTKQIIDDGASLDPKDLTGVTERRIKKITPTRSLPYGLPQVVDEFYYDTTSGKEVLIKRTKNSYTTAGRPLSSEVYDADLNFAYRLEWEYNDLGCVVKEVDALGRQTVRDYDANGNMVFEQGPQSGRHKEFVYDFANRLIREDIVTNSGERYSTNYKYDYLGNRISSTDHLGRETVYVYNEHSRLVKTIYPLVEVDDGELASPESSYSYSVMGHMKSKTDPSGRVTESTYNIRGDVTSEKYADGSEIKKRYDLRGNLVETTNREGVVTKVEYDALNRPVQQQVFSSTAQLLTTESWQYNAFHMTDEVDAEGVVTHYDYDGAGRLIGVTKGESRCEYRYDALGRKTHTINYVNDHEAVVVVQEFDLLGQVVEERTEDLLGCIVKRKIKVYDDGGNVIEEVNDFGDEVGITTYQYDALGQLIFTRSPSGDEAHVHYNYDAFNALGQRILVKTAVDMSGNQTIVEYDTLSREKICEKRDILGQILQKREMYYDLSGNCVKVKEQVIKDGAFEGEIVRVKLYDIMGREVEDCQAYGTDLQTKVFTEYDHAGRKSCVTKADGVKITFTYDPLGRLECQKSSDGSINDTFSYNNNGKIISAKCEVYHLTTCREYDANERIVWEKLGNGATIAYKYDGIGRVLQVDFSDGSTIYYTYNASGLQNVERGGKSILSDATYNLSGQPLTVKTLAGDFATCYDAAGRIEKVITPHYQESLEYDAQGNLVEKITTRRHNKYAYDELNQLTSENDHTYSYDSVLNRRSKNSNYCAFNVKNQLLNDGIYSYDYDKNGNRCARGNSSENTVYDYDALNRLRSWTKGDRRVCYLYDSSDRRLRRESFEQVSGEWIKVDTENYLYHENCEIGMFDNLGQIKQLRILGNGKGAEVGATLAMEIEGTLYIPVNDHNGNIVQLLDESGGVVEDYEMTAYGEEGDHEGHRISPWRFSSKRVDVESGLVYFGKRYYDPGVGRWLTQDPIGFLGGLNLYAYVNNGPLTQVDLYGLFSLWGHSFTCQATYILGMGLQLFGYHMLPAVPILQDVVTFAGHMLMTGDLFSYHFSNCGQRQTSTGATKGVRHVENESLIYVNGILNDKNSCNETASALEKYYGGSVIHYCHSATYGFMSDLLNCISLIVGIETRCEKELAALIRREINAVGGVGSDGKVNLWAHSRGGLVTHRALTHLTPEEKKMVHLTTIGSAKMISMKGLGSAVNYVSRRDTVPFIADPFGHIRGFYDKNLKIEYLESQGLPFLDHASTGATYSKVMKQIGRDFCDLYNLGGV